MHCESALTGLKKSKRKERGMEYQDFKYIMNDMTKVYFGAKQTYAEVCANDYVPFKMTVIISQYFYKDATPDMTIEEHIRSLTKDSLSFMTLKHLKAKVKMSIYTETTNRKGETTGKWLTDQMIPIEQYVEEESYHLYPEHAIISELVISKLQLMAFSV